MGKGQAANICASAQFPRGNKHPQMTDVKNTSGGKMDVQAMIIISPAMEVTNIHIYLNLQQQTQAFMFPRNVAQKQRSRNAQHHRC
jgi:hypothetical protein